ncbi:uncharacterized protein LOC122543499 isoform X3 [Chiloscyllium plagiosum]|uniref:uncharacterized protein LOC122543499 isoform X3 n=1 Tax=Chiloscyllium plagiosum TaxID=36176 RepID=UPI001CB845BF|nr:uncharacterized protein LOC122543499 isoform X3 [Chiloscyllium plagiosum]
MFVLKHHKVNSGATHTPTRDNPCQCDDDPKPNPGGGMHSQVRHCAGVRPPGLAHAHCRRRPGLGRKRRRSAPIAEESSRGRGKQRAHQCTPGQGLGDDGLVLGSQEVTASGGFAFGKFKPIVTLRSDSVG